MRTAFTFLFILLVGSTLTGCNEPIDAVGPDPDDIALSAQQQRIIDSDNQFGLKLFQRLSEDEGEANLFISPLSVSMALGMTLNGAEGDTRAAMEETLDLAGLSAEEINVSYQALTALLVELDPDVLFEVANSIWYREGFSVEQTFLDQNTTYFDAVVQALNFDQPEAANTINQWVEDKTHGKIEKIIEGTIDPMTVMYLINAIYFNGDWTYPFDEEATHDGSFILSDGSTATVPMMQMRKTTFPFFENETFKAIDVPYGDSLFSMTLFVPNDGQSLDALVPQLDQTQWDTWVTQFQPKKLDFFEMPKFKLEYEVPLKDALSALGMEIAFDPQDANFDGINPDRSDLHISQVKHKTFIEVDEKGTEAAAVTSVEIEVTSLGPSLRIDRPFVFAIRERVTGTILFIGKVVDPS